MILAMLKSTARIILVFIIGLAACIYFVGNTSAGLRLSLNALALFSQGQLHIGEAKGKLFSSFTLNDVNYHNAAVEVALTTLHLRWDLKLLPNHLNIKHLQAQDFTVKLHPQKNTASDFDFNQLASLKRLTVQELLLDNFTFINGKDTPIKFDEITLQKIAANKAIFFAKVLGGELNGNVSFWFGANTDWSVLLTGEHLNPGVQWPEWPGDITFALKSHGKIGNKNEAPEVLFQLENLSGSLRNLPLYGHINLALENHHFTIKEGVLTNGQANINFNGSVTDTWKMNWNIQIPDLALLVPQAHGSFTSKGALSGPREEPSLAANFQALKVAVAEHSLERLDGVVNFSVKPGVPFGLTLTGSGIKVKEHKLAKIDLAVNGVTQREQHNLVTRLNLAIAKKPYIDAEVTVPEAINNENYLTTPIVGLVSVHFPDLTTLKNYVPEVNNLRGTLFGKLNLSGTLHKPDIKGEVTLNNGNVGVPKIGVDFKNITLRLLADASRKVNYQGSFQLGNGTATLQGTTDLNSPDFTTELQLQGTNLQIVNLTDYKILASPDLKLHYIKSKLSIDGNLAIPSAKITPKDFRQTVTLPEELIFEGKKSARTTALAAMPNLQIAVQLQNHIVLRYQDLATTLGGALTIHAGPNSPATAVGSLFTIGGTYLAYGQTLTIQVGRLTYTGGLLSNPGLNIKASREITTSNTMAQAYSSSGTITAGIQISGTLERPGIALYSVPAGLSQDDILSYLVLGIPRTQATSKDSLAILNAISTVGLGGNGASQIATVTKKLQDSLGLAEMNVQTVQTFNPTDGGSVGTPSLVLGKAISKKLYVHYSVSLFSATPVSVFNLRYKFNKHWSVQTETSTIDNGADLLYTIEQN
jgi:translocation and assembly module TamB